MYHKIVTYSILNGQVLYLNTYMVGSEKGPDPEKGPPWLHHWS